MRMLWTFIHLILEYLREIFIVDILKLFTQNFEFFFEKIPLCYCAT